MANRINDFFNWFNRQNTAFLIFILCMSNYFGLTLEGGEEQYFAFAKQFADPQWMPHSFTLNHPAGGNLAFQVIIGFLLKYFSFEQVAIWGRILNFILVCIPLGLIVRRLRISNIGMVFILQVIFFGHQSLYAGEWIVKNLEEKSIAYIFVLWSLYGLLNEKPFLSSIFAALATWFHFLVGGWMFCFVFLYFVIRRRTFGTALRMGISYLVLILPLVIYLYQTYFIDNPSIINGVNTNAIYSFWRLKHHVGMFRDINYFLTWSLWGVILTMIILGLSVFVFRKSTDEDVKKLNTLNIIILCQQLLFMLLSVFDSNGLLGKTYPFRTNSLSFLIFLLEGTLAGRIYFSEWNQRRSVGVDSVQRKAIHRNYINSFLFLIAILAFVIELTKTIKDLNDYQGDLDKSMIGLIEYVKHNTQRSSVFMFLDSDRPYSFIRRADRERFVVVKFTPTKSKTLYEWYRRARIKERMRKDIHLIDSVKNVYMLNYLVSDSLYVHPSLDLEKQFGNHKLYRVRE